MENNYKQHVISTTRRRRGGKYARVEPQKPRRKKTPRFAGVIALAGLVILAVILLVSIGKKDKLQGCWQIDEITAYQFDGKGNGALILPDQSFEFHYKIRAEQVHIDFVSDSARDFSYSFSIEGDTLTLTGGEGEETVSYLLIRNDEE